MNGEETLERVEEFINVRLSQNSAHEKEITRKRIRVACLRKHVDIMNSSLLVRIGYVVTIIPVLAVGSQTWLIEKKIWSA